MAVRKEQGLLLVVLAIGLWVYGGRDAAPARFSLPAASQDYRAAEVAGTLVVGPREDPALPGRDPFLEPAESSPLPPRPLPFPARSPLPLVALPLPLGPDPGSYHLLHIPGGVVPGELAAAAGSGQEAAPTTDEPSAARDRARLERIYDQVIPVAGDVIFGILEPDEDNPDKYALAERRDWPDEGVQFRMRVYRTSTGELEQRASTIYGTQVRGVRLADNLRNEVEVRKRRLSEDLASREEREAFVEWLLQRAREESWIYDEAAAQADELVRMTGGELEAHRRKVRVFREQGDLEAEWRVYAELPEALQGTAFHLEGIGQVKARLGLFEEAEADLRRAVGEDPRDPTIVGSLAYFLLERGRPAEALPLAVRAATMDGRLESSLRMRIRTVMVASHLALGQLDLARDAITAMSSINGSEGLNNLRAALAYAEGDLAAADGLFRSASATSRTAVLFGLSPLLGVAACNLRTGHWNDALRNLESVAEAAPLLRHRALGGIGLLHLRLGQFDEALSALDRALVADPTDPYALYLRGRCLRRMGELEEAVVAQEAALRERDDLLEALAEMSETHLALAAAQPGSEAEHLFRAVRYADRVVELDRAGSLPYVELQGFAHFRASDLRGAREAFARGESLGGSEDQRLFCQIGLALVDYAQGRAQLTWRALEDLVNLRAPGDPVRTYAEATIALVEDHESKEQIVDRFERQEPGSIWDTETDRDLRPRLVDGQLRFVGSFGNKREVWARRQGAVPAGGRFVSVATTVQAVAPPSGTNSFSGLRLALAGPGGAGFRVEFGLRSGEPFLSIRDGRQEREDPADQGQVRDLQVAGLDPREPQQLELRVDADGERGNALTLAALWNGAVLHTRPLAALRENTRPELLVDLLVRGRPSAADLAVSFDDFRLVRRRQ